MLYDLYFEGELLHGQYPRKRDEQAIGDILKLPGWSGKPRGSARGLSD